MDEEYMVEQTEAAAEEESLENTDVVEEEEDTSESLDSFTGEEEAPAEEKQTGSKGTNEPGWFQSRWNKNVEKLSAQIREEVRNEYEAQIAPLKERLLDMDAKELVKSGEFKSIERAKEYLQLKQGVQPTVTEKPAEQPRNANGQYAPKEDPVVQTKIEILRKQAAKIKEKSGIDVIDIFSKNEDIKKAVISGEMDFYDVAEQAKTSRRKPPAPARSSNGASGQSPNAIDSMSKEQFARLEKKISEGARISLR